jgi:ankyrin repeat protein
MKLKQVIIAVLLALTFVATPAFAYQKRETMNREFFKAVTQGEIAKVKELLKADPQLAAAKNEKGRSAVLLATYYRKPEVVAVLLATGVELNIFEASATGQTARVRALLKQDATLVNAYAPDGFFPLGLAVFFGHRETFDVLLAAGADVNAVTRESMKITALHSAVTARQFEMARTLIARGANVNPRQAENGVTPLHEAVANGSIEFAKLLLEHKADLNAKTKDGKTPLAHAVSRSQKEMASWLRERGAL